MSDLISGKTANIPEQIKQNKIDIVFISISLEKIYKNLTNN
tara:strand:- start:33404 stop:33526 length:123 start_codon:yes stop_codon:yes gene_type:complete